MSKKVIYLVSFILLQLYCSSTLFSQIIYYQDIFKGEVSVVGISSGDATGIVTLPTGLGNQTSIKKIFLVCYGDKGFHFIPTGRNFAIDNVPYPPDQLHL